MSSGRMRVRTIRRRWRCGVAIGVAMLGAIVATPTAGAAAEPRGPAEAADGRLTTREDPLPGLAGARRTYLFRPASWDRAGSWPLVVALPGGTGDAEPFVGQNRTLFTEAGSRGFIVLVPSSSMAYDPALRSGGVSLREAHAAYVAAAIDRTVDEASVDQERIFLAGVSAGGAGAWRLATETPERFRAVVLVAPAGAPPDERLDRLRGSPLLVIQGTADRAIRRGENRRTVERMLERGLPARLIEITHAGHRLESWPVWRWALDFFERHDRPER